MIAWTAYQESDDDSNEEEKEALLPDLKVGDGVTIESLKSNGHRTTPPARYTEPTLVKKLEEGDLPLEGSLQLYERGVQLSRYCHSRLEDAERRIAKLRREFREEFNQTVVAHTTGADAGL